MQKHNSTSKQKFQKVYRTKILLTPQTKNMSKLNKIGCNFELHNNKSDINKLSIDIENMIKQQIIEFCNGYYNCDLSPEEYGEKFQMTEYETISTLRLGKLLSVSNRFANDKRLIEQVLREKNMIAIELAKKLNMSYTVISNVINLRRGIPKKNRVEIEQMLRS